MADTTKKKKIDAEEVMAVGESDIALNDTANAVTSSTNKATDWQAQSDAYSKQADEYLDRYANGEKFSYDFNVDPVFQAAKQAYERSGKLAAEDVQGRAAALSGGYSNSYGATAAQQAYNQSIDNLYDTIPELENAAYNRYQNEQQKNLTLHEAYQNKADSAENKANNAENKAYTYALQLAQLGQYDKLGEFLGVDLSGVQQDEEYQKKLNNALQLAEIGDYSGLTALGIDVSKLEFKDNLEIAQAAGDVGDYSYYENMGFDTSSIKKEEALADALQRAQFGDYSALEALGYNTSAVKEADALSKALQLAQIGDYAPLEALGYDTKKLKDNDLLSWAQVAAEAGDYSLYKELGIDTSALEYERDFTNALQMAQVGDYSGLKKLGINASVQTTGSGAYKKTDDTPKVDVSSIASNIKKVFLGDYDGSYAKGNLKAEEINAFQSALTQAYGSNKEAIDTDVMNNILLQAGIPAARIDALWDYFCGTDDDKGSPVNGVKKKTAEQIAAQDEIAKNLGFDTDSARKEKFLR